MNLKNKRRAKARVRPSLKLRIELIPKPLWEQNLRSDEGLGRERWDKLRRELIKEHGSRCAICGATEKRLHGHGVWDYREKKTVGSAVLLRVEIACVDCHDIHHWARTAKLFEAGKITAERYKHLRKHFRAVNGCRQEDFDQHFLQSTRIWEKRSSKQWKVDWGHFTSLVLWSRRGRLGVRGPCAIPIMATTSIPSPIIICGVSARNAAQLES